MTKITALGVSPGIGIGTALVLESAEPPIPAHPGAGPKAELARLEQALEAVAEETRALLTQAQKAGPQAKADILSAYLMLVEDAAVTESARALIANEGQNAAMAAGQGIGQVAKLFESMDDDYMRERAFDIWDIRRRVLYALLGIQRASLDALEPNTVIIAEDLTTSDTARLNFSHVSGIITSAGGLNSHASIMARSFEVPAVAGAKGIFALVENGCSVVLDGASGVCCIRPNEETLVHYLNRQEQHLAEKERLRPFRARPSLSADGQQVHIGANIGAPAELGRVLESGADGIGLMRSEFMYMGANRLPGEDAQYEAYKEVVMALAPKPVIIRTMDIGGDKALPYMNLEQEENPFLGFRAIRICLQRPQLFATQLRALLRAGRHGNLRVMFPMVSSLEELRQAKAMVQRAKEELRAEGKPFGESIRLGIMVEVPSAALMAEELAAECDFFSIGTNDLIQYTAAVDRGNERVSGLYSPCRPSVLRLIAHTIRSAHKKGIPCGMCGEAAGNLQLVPLFLGMGLDEFSMNAGAVLAARELISRLHTGQAKKLAENVLSCATRTQVEQQLSAFSRQAGL